VKLVYSSQDRDLALPVTFVRIMAGAIGKMHWAVAGSEKALAEGLIIAV
jgi:hypothetical protein